MLFFEVFDELCIKCGLEPHSQSQDETTLLFDGQHAVTFQPDAEDKSVIFSAEICDVASLTDDGPQILLKVSLLGAQTSGAAFAISPELGKVVLWKRYDENFEDLTALEEALNSFLAAVITWKTNLSSVLAANSDEQNSTYIEHIRA